MLLGAGFWAGRVTLAPVPVPADLPRDEVLVEVTEQSVGRTLNLGVLVTQPTRDLATNTLTGVVTWVSGEATFSVGDRLYEVAGTPVRVVEGQVPFYRDLAQGVSGADVGQLRDALVELGYLSDPGTVFDNPTRIAVRAWQSDLGVERSGQVLLGELVAAPDLPAALILDEEALGLSRMLLGGERLVFATDGDPGFTLVLSEQQARLVPDDAHISMDHQGRTWSARISGSRPTELGEVALDLTAPDGGPVCALECDLMAEGAGADMTLIARVTVVPPVTGPAVPVAAITTHPDGTTSVTVTDPNGSRLQRPVSVLGSQDGIAVVDGLEVGELVQALAATDQA